MHNITIYANIHTRIYTYMDTYIDICIFMQIFFNTDSPLQLFLKINEVKLKKKIITI